MPCETRLALSRSPVRTHTIKCGGSVNGACEARVVRDGTADFRTCSGSPQFPRVYNSTVREIEERESSHFAAPLQKATTQREAHTPVEV